MRIDHDIKIDHDQQTGVDVAAALASLDQAMLDAVKGAKFRVTYKMRNREMVKFTDVIYPGRKQ